MSEQTQRTGVYRATANSYGFFMPDEGGTDCFVPPRESGSAWDGDRVAVCPIPGEETGDAVRVVRVMERAHSAVVGILRRENRQYWLYPTDRKLPSPILVTGGVHNAHNGDRAAVEMRSYACEHGQVPSGALSQIFGPADEFYTIVEAILFEHGIFPQFPPAVMEQVESIPDTVGEEELTRRLDLRSKKIITIDGASSRDFDDAVSLERDGDGNWELGVHIADVSHYVPLGSHLDIEALGRGTSVYFADRVVPMLPIALSNEICSLNPGVDRLTMSCLMTLNDRGEILAHKIAKSVIRSAERMTYEDCNLLLEGESGGLAGQYAHVLPMLRDMADLAEKRKKLRRLRGSLTLESREMTVRCDEDGEPVGLEVREQGQSESLIEEFMLAANETVAKHLHDAGMPAVYRVHEAPSSDKLESLRAALNPLGYQVGQGDSFALQKIVDEAGGKPEAPMVNALLLRAQKKARYDRENLSHFALAAPYYCHFTSPIRRYPDLMVHRALTALLDEGANGRTRKKLDRLVGDTAWKSSQREMDAVEAEREIGKRYAARYLADHIGEPFPGAVSGATRNGLFVLLSCGAEGRLPLEFLPPDRYEFEEGTLTLSGTEHRYTIGTPITVVIAAADVESGQVELALEGVIPSAVGPVRREEKPKRREKPFPEKQKHRSFKPPRKKPGGGKHGKRK